MKTWTTKKPSIIDTKSRTSSTKILNEISFHPLQYCINSIQSNITNIQLDMCLQQSILQAIHLCYKTYTRCFFKFMVPNSMQNWKQPHIFSNYILQFTAGCFNAKCITGYFSSTGFILHIRIFNYIVTLTSTVSLQHFFLKKKVF